MFIQYMIYGEKFLKENKRLKIKLGFPDKICNHVKVIVFLKINQTRDKNCALNPHYADGK